MAARRAASGTDPQTRQKALLAYAQCMRDHGVDMKDPTFDANGRPQFNGGGGTGGGFFGRGANADDPTFQKAQQACRSNLQGLQGQFNLDPQQQAELRKNLLAFAQCMRDNGVDMQDPTFDANGRPQFNGGGGGGPAAGANRNDPMYQKAFEACQSKIGSFRPGGRGGPGGPATTAGRQRVMGKRAAIVGGVVVVVVAGLASATVLTTRHHRAAAADQPPPDRPAEDGPRSPGRTWCRPRTCRAPSATATRPR